MRRPLLSSAERRVQKAINALLVDGRVKRAFDFIDSSSERFNAEHIRICEVPAPPFKEHERARYFAARFTELRLSDVHIDSEGNAIGFYPGSSDAPLIVLLAHLDTVFPESTDVRVRIEGMYAPRRRQLARDSLH
jgi:acetylornithine deacetylase/succinyl-diaminopimelate desuccinylase-like protein